MSTGAAHAARSGGPFSRRAAILLTVLGGGALAATVLFSILGSRSSGGNEVATALRRSAVGYRALVRLLETEVPVEAGRGLYPDGLAADRPLLILDPAPYQVDQLYSTTTRAEVDGVPVVVVLPKWDATLDPAHPGWVADVTLLPGAAVTRVLAAAFGETVRNGLALERPEAVGEPLAAETADDGAPPAFAGLRPDLPQPQLVIDRHDNFEPLIAYRQGLLVGKLRDRDLYLVSDPDLLNVAGLGRGDNAVIAHRLLVDLLAPSAWVVREGSYGGLPPVQSVWMSLFRPPLTTVTLHAAGLALLALWLATGRFGRPLEAPPRVAPGKRTLVDNTARLLETAGDPGDALQRYLRLTTEAAAERLGLPPGLDVEERRRRLHRIGRSRGASRPLANLVADADRLPAAGAARRRRAVEVAAALHRWKEETLDGSVPHA